MARVSASTTLTIPPRGDAAVSYWLVPSVTSVSRVRNADGSTVCSPRTVNVKVMKRVGGEEAYEVTDMGAEGLVMSRCTGRLVDGETVYDTEKYTTAASVAMPTVATVRDLLIKLYQGATVIDTCRIAIVDNGERGERGPVLRGPQAWSDCEEGYEFEAGGEGDMWQDVVLHNGNYYMCKVSHAKSADNAPGSAMDELKGYWATGSAINLVIANIILSRYILVQNLGVEVIDMKDADGNVLFRAKDGEVMCRTGVFENIDVTGNITAESMNLKRSTRDHYVDVPEVPDGSICESASGIILPELPEGTVRSSLVLNPMLSRSGAEDLVLRPATAFVYISQNLSRVLAVNSDVTIPSYGRNSGRYLELIGSRGWNDPVTVWLLSEKNNGIVSQ